MNHVNICRIPAVQFTYELWRAGSLTELGIPHREWGIRKHLDQVKRMAVGYTEANKLYVRPKFGCIAVMFHYQGKHFWTHLTNKEFIICYPDLEIYLRNIGS